MSKSREKSNTVCIICNKSSTLSEHLSSPQDYKSWETLCDAARIRDFEPILILSRDPSSSIPDVFYHRKCRASFTSKTNLTIIEKQKASTSQDSSSANYKPRRSSRQGASGATVLQRICIFCEKTKYLKGQNSREGLVQSVDLRADETLRAIAIERCDERILAITSREIVAAEAHYHKTCYRQYTRKTASTSVDKSEEAEESDDYQKTEKESLVQLYHCLRYEIFLDEPVCSMIDITSRMVSFMEKNGIRNCEVSESTKKHLRRKIEAEFGDSLHFFTVNRRVFVRQDSLSLEKLLPYFVSLKMKYEGSINTEMPKSNFQKIALSLRNEIKASLPEQHWPPQPQELNSDYLTVPQNLTKFITDLLSGTNTLTSDRVKRLSWSISEDIVYGVAMGQVFAPKHILLAFAVKTLTGNAELIKTLNRLGHTCSYSKLEEIDTALCIEKLEISDSVPLPNGIYPNVPTVLAFDNIDRLEEVLSGSGTSHRVNGIIVQPVSDSCLPPRLLPQLSKQDKKRTIHNADKPLDSYYVRKRKGPLPIRPMDITFRTKELVFQAQVKDLIWIMVRDIDSVNQTISAWTGFNILTRNNVMVTPDSIGYLPTINAPATELATVQEVLRNCLEIKRTLNLSAIAVVFDQALYAKATEIMWANQDQYNSIFLMMGNFHTICNFMSSIGKMFGDAGLRDVAVESGVIAEGSINKVLEGKQYNRAVRFHKLMFEALMRVAWRGFISRTKSKSPESAELLEKGYDALSEVHRNTCHETYTTAVSNQSCDTIIQEFIDYLDTFRNQRGDLSKFWMIYLDMVGVLLQLLRADREGDWYLHLSAIREVIPWSFAMDKVNYSRYLPYYYATMTQLENTCPELYEHFRNGGFSVQLRKVNPFGKIAVDQTTEETVNKDTQTAGGTRGFSLKPGTVARYYLTAEHRASALRQLREQINTQNTAFSHPDLQEPRIKRDEEAVTSITDILENNWTNPFGEDPSDVISISTGTKASLDVATDLLSAREKGEAAYRYFQDNHLSKGTGFYDPFKKLKLKTFTAMKKPIAKGKNKEITLKADHRLFANMVLISESRKLDMQDVFSHPLGSLPWTLANADGTMKKTNKAVLSNYLESKIAPVSVVPCPKTTIIDAMALIQKLQGENHTFDELSDKIFSQILHVARDSDRVDVVFDVYKINSIKSMERAKRGSQEGIAFGQIRPNHKIKNWRRLLTCDESKNNLIEFLALSWQDQKRREKLGNKKLYVAHMGKCNELTKDNIQEIEDLNTNQEEADTRLVLHAKHAGKFYPNVICVSDDTDVLVLFLAFNLEMNTNVFLMRGQKSKVRILDVSKLVNAIGVETCSALIGLHAFTGCDTVSAMAGHGKLKALKIISKNEKYRKTIHGLGEKWNLDENIFDEIQKLTCQIYCNNTKVTDVNTLRYQIFRAKKGNVESGQLPPCADTLRQHTLRANYQAAIWKRSLEAFADIPDPTDGYGWTKGEEGLDILWMTGPPAPDIVLSLMACKCTRVCRPNDCTCILNNLKCTAACKNTNCTNMVEEEDMYLRDPKDTDSSDSEDD